MYTNEDSLRMIEAFSNTFGPSGFEDEMLYTAEKFLKGFADIKDDKLRNIYITPRQQGEDSRRVLMLDAHCDEVGFMIHSIRPNGTLRFVTLGRQTENTLPSTKVRVRNGLGEYIPGVIAAKPVHFMSPAEKDKPLRIEDLSIDIGAVSSEDAAENFHIRIGEPAVPDVAFTYDAKSDMMIGKGFDCRIGCAALAETLRRLYGTLTAFRLQGVLSSQEEVGERGVAVAVRQIQPDVAICFEGCPADDTFTEPYAVQTALKKGPMLRFMDTSVICSPRFMRFALDTAEQLHIPVQASVRTGGGNNGAVINLAGRGIPVIVIGIPVRYIHSAHGIAAYSDFEAAVSLAAGIIRRLDEAAFEQF